MSGNECFALTLGLGIVCLSCASSVKQGLFCKETSRVTKGGTRPIVTTIVGDRSRTRSGKWSAVVVT